MPAPKRLDPRSPLAVWGAELRSHREAAGWTQSQFAQRVNYSVAQISSIETGRQNPTDEFAEHCDRALGLKGTLARLLRRLRDLVVQEVYPEWFRPWVPEEERAVIIRTFQLSLVDGLLQTEDYARALLGGNEEAVEARMNRQKILTRTDPPPPKLICVLDESVLYREVGGREIMRAQLEYLISVVSSKKTILVVPCGVHDGVSGSFMLATLHDGNEVAYFDTAARGMVTSSRDDLTAIAEAWESIRTYTFPQQESLDLISRTAEQRWT
ncbi:MAG TPA: helix-turn-helix transcriptional regulator [Gemmatimonadales bacterium]|nr:helix-turn-helix transcriptional regulator [Gemmatimonadales bacterium]